MLRRDYIERLDDRMNIRRRGLHSAVDAIMMMMMRRRRMSSAWPFGAESPRNA